MVDAHLAEDERAMAALVAACDERAFMLRYLAVNPALDHLRPRSDAGIY